MKRIIIYLAIMFLFAPQPQIKPNPVTCEQILDNIKKAEELKRLVPRYFPPEPEYKFKILET